jgi:hypothetical protein
VSNDRFTKEETAEIIRRSLELQEKSKESQSGSTSALEIRAAAAEIGIDPIFIDQAISTRGRSLGTTVKKGFLGAVKTVSYEGVFPGSLSEDQWVKTVQNLRANFGDKGELETLGSTKEWFRSNSVAPAHFSVKSDDKESLVSTSIDLTSINFIPFLPGLPVWMLTSIGLGVSSIPPDFKAVVIVLWFVVYAYIARLIARALGKKLIAKMMQSVDDFQTMIQADVSSSDSLRDQLANGNTGTEGSTILDQQSL